MMGIALGLGASHGRIVGETLQYVIRASRSP